MAAIVISLLTLCASASAWIAVTPVANNKVDVFQMDDAGKNQKDVLSFPVAVGEVLSPNSFSCGRCFCLIMTTSRVTMTSTLYNMSFCLVPQPAVETQVTLPGLAYNLHSFEGEGDGGNGITILIDHTTTPQSYHVVQVVGKAVQRAVDISPYVDAMGGNVYPGGTAFCAESKTLWVAIQTRDPEFDTLITLDLNANKVIKNITMPKPALTSHFADCSTNTLGGFTQQSALGLSTVYVGNLDEAGVFTAFDSAALPKGSTMQLAAIGDFMHDPRLRWDPSSYGAILYSAPMSLPGLLFVSTAGKKGPASLNPLTTLPASISVEY